MNVVVLVRGKVFKYMSYGFATLRDLGIAEFRQLDEGSALPRSRNVAKP